MDRDGTINEEVSFLSRMEQLRLYPQTYEAIRLINAAGMKAVVVTNQSGIARGYFTEDFVRTVHERINEMLRAEGAHIDGFYVCPHHPVYGNGIYKQHCSCRKPKPGMLLQAARGDEHRPHTLVHDRRHAEGYRSRERKRGPAGSSSEPAMARTSSGRTCPPTSPTTSSRPCGGS